MNTEHQHSDSRANDLPIAESTQIEKIAKTPLKRLRLTLANRFGLYNSNSNSPTTQTPPPKRNTSILHTTKATPTPTLNKLDPQVYLDTQSNGFASRVVKYHEASEAKTRDIANKSYRRLGDFPIVNLDKSEINLNQKQANAPKVSKIHIAPPINLVSASARSAIFRTGKNYGDSYALGGPIGKIGPIEGRKPLRTSSMSQDEPIVPSTSDDYDGGSARSSLEALKEISRKRIHCDEIDGEVNKKQKGESTQDEGDSNNGQTPSGSKRSRDRTSPSYCSSSNEVQNKRYRNNDILSSLSSSILMSTPKRSLLNADAAPAKVIHLDHDEVKDTHDRSTVDCASSVKQRSTESSSRVGTSNSDLPLHRPMEQIKPVIKSVSDGHVPKSETSKTPKLTLFNRDYSKIPVSNERSKSIVDDDDDYSVSFVKPKAKTSTIFSGSKNRGDQQSKLKLMLSFLRGDESKDEVDSVPSSKAVDDKKANEKDEPKVIASSSSSLSPSANLSTNTSVTFSTATTTSVLIAPSDVIKTSPIEVKPPNKETNEISKEPEKVSTSSGINLVPVTSTPAIILPVSSAAQSEEKPSTPARTVTFNLSPVQSTAAPISLGQTTSTSSDSVPRLGGFSFSATSTSFTLPTVAKPALEAIPTATLTDNTLTPKSSTENKKSTPIISFGLPQSTGTNNSTIPSLGTPVFGSANAMAKPATANTGSTQSNPNQTTSAPPTFSFGNPATKPTLAPNASVGFGTLSSSTAANTTTSHLVGTTTPSMFSFGTNTNTTNPLTNPAPSATFGSNIRTTAPPAFGFNPTAPGPAGVSTATTSLPTLNQSKPSFSFGNAVSSSKPETSAFQFGNTTSTKPPVMTFGSTATTTSATPLFGSGATTTPLFGANTNANTTANTQSTFTFTPNKPALDTKPLQFGTPTPTTTPSTGLGAFTSPAPPAFGSQTNSAAPPPPYGQTPTFGSLQQHTHTPTTTSSTSLFGNASNQQSTSIFGSNNNAPSSLPKVENTFGIPSNQNQNSATPVFGSNQPSAFGGSGMNPPAFGSTGSNVFGNAPTTQSQPTFGSGSSLFSTPSTTAQSPPNNNAFGSSGVFSFGQNSTQSPPNTTPQGIFGSSNTNTTASAPFVFGQSNNNTNNTATPNQSAGIFGAKPADGLNANSALSAPPSFGGSPPAFNFNAAKPNTGFSFNASNAPAPAANVPAFGSASAAPQFGSSNGLGTSFSFNAPNNTADASKPFAFGGPATAPAAPQASFSFNAPTPTPAPNAFQFNAQQQQQQPAAANIFSIGPGSGTNTTKTGRPMRTATRRIK